MRRLMRTLTWLVVVQVVLSMVGTPSVVSAARTPAPASQMRSVPPHANRQPAAAGAVATDPRARLTALPRAATRLAAALHLGSVSKDILPLSSGAAFIDTFNRPNGAIGAPWQQLGDATGWTISNQQAQSPGSGQDFLVYNAGGSDGTITGTLVNQQAVQFGGLIFRGVDANNGWGWGKGTNGNYQLGVKVNRVVTIVIDTGIGGAPGDVLQVVMNGDSIQGIVNGAVLASTTSAQYDTATLHGFGCYNPTCLFDDFSYVPPGYVSPLPPGTQYIDATYGGGSQDPVQTFTGAFGYRHTDVAIAGRGPTPVVVRSYNSNDTRSGRLGPGWTDNYAMSLVSPGGGSGDMILKAPDGRSDRYQLQADGTFQPPPAVYTTLVKHGDGSSTATLQDQSSWSFDTSGRLTNVADRYGNQSTLTYNAQGQLTSVSDPAGRGSLTFGYNASGLLTSVTDWASPARSVQNGYDGSGRLQTVTDRNGKVTTYGYDGTTSHLTTITDANTHVAVTMTYDTSGRVQTQKDARGLTTGQATSFSYAVNADGSHTTTVTYPTTSLEPSFHPTVADTYDGQGRLTSRVTKPSSTETYTVTRGYDANFDTTAVTDARGNTTTTCFDVDYHGVTIGTSHGNVGRLISPPPATGQNPLVTLMAYDTKNNLVETIAPKGVASGASVTCQTDLSAAVNTLYATDMAYETNGILLLSVTKRFTDPDVGAQTAITKYEYTDSANPGLATFITPPRGNTGSTPDHSYATAFTYNGSGSQAGMVQQVQDAVGDKTTYTYDNVGRRLTMVDPNGNASGGAPGDHTWSYAYDNEDRLLTASAPAPVHGGAALVTTSQYDPVGNRTALIDANGQVSKYLYDERDSLSEVDQSPLAWTVVSQLPSTVYVTTYTYDNLGNMNRVTRAANDTTNVRVTDYAYDGLNRVRTETQYPNWPTSTPTLVTTTTYDPNSNRASLVDPLNQTTQFAYDILNRLTGITYVGGGAPNVFYSYDANGNRLTMGDGTGSTSYTYDEQNRLLTVTSPGSVVVGYRYDLDGNRRKLLYPDATAVTYAFDKADRLQSLADWASRTTSYGYFPDGHLQTTTNVNGTTATLTEDNAQRLTQVWNKTSGGSTISKHAYALDNVGNRTQVAENLALWRGGSASPNVTYSYDKLYRLTQEAAPTYTSIYQYDPVGNRTQFNQGGTPVNYAYDKADRIQTAGVLTYTVNANGNLVSRNNDTFTYDQANRLTSVHQGRVTSQHSVTTNTYDGDGKRVTMAESTHTTITYVYDVNRGLPVVLQDGIHKNVWGLGLAYTVSMDGQNTVQVPHTDGLGSIRALTDSTGTVVEDYQTDGFGVPVATDGPNYTQRFQYAGEQRDYDGLIYLRARFYEPVMGRFMGRDPVPGRSDSPTSLDRFTYAEDNPVRNVDPSGMRVQITPTKAKLLRGSPAQATCGASFEPDDGPCESEGAGGGGGGTGDIGWDWGVTGVRNLVSWLTGGGARNPPSAPSYVVTPGGDMFPVPAGASGPIPTRNGRGMQYIGGSDGSSLDSKVAGVRLMDPTPRYPNGYASYFNAQGQAVDPMNGLPIARSDPWWHIPFSPP